MFLPKSFCKYLFNIKHFLYNERKSYEELMKWARPEVIVHCAAITNVDYCEVHAEQATMVNAESVKKFLQSDYNARLIFISSDAVFPGGLHMASEKDATAPENVYGISKNLGEKR